MRAISLNCYPELYLSNERRELQKQTLEMFGNVDTSATAPITQTRSCESVKLMIRMARAHFNMQIGQRF